MDIGINAGAGYSVVWMSKSERIKLIWVNFGK